MRVCKTTFVEIDRICDYTPFVSTVSNIIDIFLKCVVQCLSEETVANNRYWSHIKQKDLLRCVCLLVPILGNIYIILKERLEILRDMALARARRMYARDLEDPLRNPDSSVTQMPVASSFQDQSTQLLQTKRQKIEKIQCPIALLTGRAATEGFYISPSGKRVSLRSGEQLLEGSCVVTNSILESSMKMRYENSTIEVVDKDCLVAAQDELKNGANKVAVLMFASPIEPGGAMEEGNNGQEEDLCRRSDIFGFMWDQAHFTASRSLYNLVDLSGPHQVNPDYSVMANNKMIHVPQVTVFRSGKSDNYKLLEDSFEVGMLISSALDRPAYEKTNEKTQYKRKEDKEQLRKLIMTQLKISYDENYDTVVLGAFGCGAFYNPPELIAQSYKEIIDQHFKGAFKKIVFAILDDGHHGQHNPEGNLKPFQERFSD